MTERGRSPHEFDITALLNEIDEFADRSIHPELTDTQTLDRLLTLQDFASRLYRPKREVVIKLEKIKKNILESYNPYPDEPQFRQMLKNVYRKNPDQFIALHSF